MTNRLLACLSAPVFALSALVVAAAPAGAVNQPPPTLTTRGIDVARYQGNTVNWKAAKASGISFAYAKATEWTSNTTPYVNSYFNSQYNGAKSAGMYAGAYVFARPDFGNPTAQADFLMRYAQYSNDGRTMPPMLDMEAPYGSLVSKGSCWGRSPSAMVSWIRSFVDRVRAVTGKPTVIYANKYWWITCTGNSTAFTDQFLDIASWPSQPISPSYRPSLPGGWARWTFWQWADAGAFPGGQDVFNGSLADLAALCRPANTAGSTSPVVRSRADGSLDVFYKAYDGSLWTTSYSGGWPTPNLISADTMTSDPAVVAQSSGVIDVFWRRADGYIGHAWRVAGTWYGPASFPAKTTGMPSVVAVGGKVWLFYRGEDGQLWTMAYIPATGWSAPSVLPAGVIGGTPQAILHSDGSIDVFWRGGDRKVWSIGMNSAGLWQSVQALGGAIAGDPTPVDSTTSVTDVFWRGTDQNLWHVWRVSGTWYGPAPLDSGRIGSDPAAAGQPSGTIDVFWRGGDNALWHRWYVGTGWYGPERMNAYVQTKPSVTAQANGVVDVFFNDGARALGHRWYDGTGWWGPSREGGFLS